MAGLITVFGLRGIFEPDRDTVAKTSASMLTKPVVTSYYQTITKQNVYVEPDNFCPLRTLSYLACPVKIVPGKIVLRTSYDFPGVS